MSCCLHVYNHLDYKPLFASHVWHNGQQCKLVFNAVFNAMRTLSDLTRIYLYQSFIKTVINTAITVKLLTSKVTLLNTCEKLKMTHEKQLDLGNTIVPSKLRNDRFLGGLSLTVLAMSQFRNAQSIMVV